MENKGVNLLCYKQYCSNGHLYEGFIGEQISIVEVGKPQMSAYFQIFLLTWLPACQLHTNCPS